MRFILNFAALLLVASFLVGCTPAGPVSPSSKDSATPLKVGFIVPLSGGWAVYGEEVQRGVEIATANRSDFKVIFEDDKGVDTSVVASSSNKLINLDNVDVGVGLINNHAHIAGPLFDAQKKPFIVLWDSGDFVNISPYVFGMGFSLEATGRRMARYLMEHNVTRIAAVSVQDPGAAPVMVAFRDEYKKRGGTILLDDLYQATDIDYRTSIIKAKALDVQGVYVLLVGQGAASYVTQARELAPEMQLYATDGYSDDARRINGADANGIILSDVYPESTVWLEEYRARYHEEPHMPIAVDYGYNVIKRLERARLNTDGLEAGLVTVFGPTRRTDRVARIYILQNGTESLVEE